MNKAYKIYASRAAGLLMTAATLAVAALVIFQCADIYLTGTSPENMTQSGVLIHDVYSREIVAERFSRISWAFIAWVAVLFFTAIVRAVMRGEKRETLEMPLETRLGLLKSRVTLTPAMTSEERKRRIESTAGLAVCAICAAMVGVYMLDLENFASRDLENVMGAMLSHITPWIAVAFAALMILAQALYKSTAREIEAAKDAPKRNPEPPKAQKNTLTIICRALTYIAAVYLIIAGIMNGGMYDVLVKAVNICTECIGLG